jgi:hypothetical protein
MADRFALVLVAGAAALLALVPGARAAEGLSEYRAKAAFIHAFVEWPDGALAPAAPIEIAVLGRPAGEEVQAALAGLTSRRHPINVHVYDRAADIGPCHVLFVTVDGGDDLRAALRAFEHKAVLTIAEGSVALVPSPAITLFVADTRLAFTVDLDAADAHGVRPSANLLRLAQRVRGRKLAAGP